MIKRLLYYIIIILVVTIDFMYTFTFSVVRVWSVSSSSGSLCWP